MIRPVGIACWFHLNLALTLVDCKKPWNHVSLWKNTLLPCPKRISQSYIETNAKSAPTKFVKCFMNQEGVDHDMKRARASSCLVQTYNSCRKQQHSVVLRRALLLLWLYHTYGKGCMTPGRYHVNTSYVSNMYGNIKNFWVLTWIPNISLNPGKKWCMIKIPATKERRYRHFRCTERLGAATSPWSTPIRSYCSGQDRRKHYLFDTYYSSTL